MSESREKICKSKVFSSQKIFTRDLSCVFLTCIACLETVMCNINLIIYLVFRTQSFTSLKADIHQDIKGGFAFNLWLNATFPWRKGSINALVSHGSSKEWYGKLEGLEMVPKVSSEEKICIGYTSCLG